MASGGCAFRGAKMALQPIADAVHLVHGPVTCQGLAWEVRPTPGSGPDHHRHAMATDLREMDVIGGGEARLQAAVAAVVAARDPAGVFVYQTCVPAMVGDDVHGLCRRLSRQFHRPVVAVDVPGFAGGRDTGADAAGRVLLDQVIGTREPEHTTTTDVVLIGEYNVAGEVWQATGLLRALGIRVLASIPGDGRIGAIATAHRARAAVTLCSQAMGGLAEGLWERHGVPFVQGSFYGMGNIAATLRALCHLLADRGGPTDLPARADSLVAALEASTRTRLRPLLADLRGRRALLLAGGIKTWALAGALRELGMEVAGSTLRKASDEDCRRAVRLLGEECVRGGGADSQVEAELAGGGVDVVLGSDGLRHLAFRTGIPWVDVTHGRRVALSGYDGMVNLGGEIRRALRHPLRRPGGVAAPWHRARGGGA
nr:nitrogenase component 1 [Magnetospirillum aberrantis]